MPLIERSSFKAPFYISNNHLQTIYPSMFRQVEGPLYTRERITLPDNDFMDLDWATTGSKKLILALHGLEGDANRPYIRALIKLFNSKGWDGVGLNLRGCSGEINKALRTYHSGDTDDLKTVLNHIESKGIYEEIAIVGYSLGGNITMKYMGENGNQIHPLVKKAVGVSVPVDLAGCSKELNQWKNLFYMRSFMVELKAKAAIKEKMFPGAIDYQAIYNSKNFLDFDNSFTAPVFGFKDAKDYWAKSNSLQFLSNIKQPTLLINSLDDSFLSRECYPAHIAKSNPNFFLETPENGGHVGFVTWDEDGYYWIERRIYAFIAKEQFD